MPSYWPFKAGLGLSAWVILLWCMTLPQSLVIADEKAYYEQALALAEGGMYTETPLAAAWPGYIPKHYPMGTALWLAPGIGIGGPQGAFGVILLAWLGSWLLLRRSMGRLWQAEAAALCVLAFPPAIVISRHLMSEIPSLLMLSLWVVACLRLWEKPAALPAFAAGFCAGLVVLFREANLLLVLPWLVVFGLRNRVTGFMALSGFALALCVRLFTAWWAYGDPFYLKAPGVGFSILNVPANLPLYLLGLLVFLPGGLWVAWRYKGPWQGSWRLGLGLYLGLHLTYGYAGNHDHWAEGLVLGLRYLIPTLPLFACAYAHYLSSSAPLLRWSRHWALAGIVGLLIAFGYGLDHQLGKQQLALRSQLIDQGRPICEKPAWYEYCSRFYD